MWGLNTFVTKVALTLNYLTDHRLLWSVVIVVVFVGRWKHGSNMLLAQTGVGSRAGENDDDHSGASPAASSSSSSSEGGSDRVPLSMMLVAERKKRRKSHKLLWVVAAGTCGLIGFVASAVGMFVTSAKRDVVGAIPELLEALIGVCDNSAVRLHFDF
jgi:hypothetical protein